MKNITQYFFYISALALVLELAVSLLRHDEAYQDVKETGANIGVSVLDHVFAKPLLTIPVSLLMALMFRIAPLRLAETAGTWVAGIVIYDFVYYWKHRLSHETRLFWAFHSVHHSSPEYNLAVAGRNTFLTSLYEWFFLAPLCLIGLPPEVILVSRSVNLTYQFFLHTKYVPKMKDKILNAVMNTPSHHRVHHGSNEIYLDKNYAGVFIIWDRLFGTFTEEKEEVHYGLTKPLNTSNIVTINFIGFIDLFRGLREQRTPGERYRYLLSRPNAQTAKYRNEKNTAEVRELTSL